MKKNLRLYIIASLAFSLTANAATVVWTNTAGGNWTAAANWSPNQVPGSSDTAMITNAGTYTVALGDDVTVAGIMLGASSGSSTQTLSWTGGTLSECDVAVSPQGILRLEGAGWKLLRHCIVNNAGTFLWTGTGGIQAEFTGSDKSVLVTNLPGALFEIQTDATYWHHDGGSINPTDRIHNAGTLRKTGGTGTNLFASQVQFINTGRVELQEGAFAFPNGFRHDGALDLAPGTLIHLRGGTSYFGAACTKTGAGRLLVDSNDLTLMGTVPSLTWTGGRLADSDFTVASGAVLSLEGGNTKTLLGSTMRNAGTILWSGTGGLLAEIDGNRLKVAFTNLPGGVFEIQTDAAYSHYDGGTLGWTDHFHNAGLLRKVAGAGTTTFASHVAFVNTGTVQVEQGSIVFPVFRNDGSLIVQTGASATFPLGFVNNGVFDLHSGMVVNLAGGTFTFGPASQLIGGGSLVIPNGDVTLLGTVPSFSWTGGRLVESDLTVATNAVLSIGGADLKVLLHSTLNNAGTVIWSGTGALRAEFTGTDRSVLVTNLPGAVFEMQSDAPYTHYDGGSLGWTDHFHNAGTLRKTGGTGTSAFDSHVAVISTGFIDVQTGTLDFAGAINQIGGRVNFGISSPTVFGRVNLASQASIRAIVSAALNNPSGLVAGNQFAVLNRGSRPLGNVVFAGRNLGGGFVYDPAIGSSALTLVLRAATHPTPPVISLSYAPQLPAFVLMEGTVGPSYRLQASTDLTTWTSLETNAAPAGAWEFSDPDAPSFGQRFYQGVEVGP